MKILEIFKHDLIDVTLKFDVNGCPINSYMKTLDIDWVLNDYPLALIIVVDNKWVGWIQTIFSLRNNRVTCNLSSWYVYEEYRAYSLNLMLYIRSKFKNIPVTVFTPSGKAAQIYDALNVTKLDADRWYYRPRPRPIIAGIINNKSLKLLPAEICTEILDNTNKSINFFLIRHKSSICVFSMRRRVKNEKVLFDILSIKGDPRIFFDGFSFQHQAVVDGEILIDDRFVPNRIKKYLIDNSFIEECRLPNARYILNASKEESIGVDFLYSEVILNNSSLL
jgi:hypothetical protein